MNLVMSIVLSVIRVFNVILHTTGCYLLVAQYRRGEDTVQQVYLINLSIAEAAQNLLTIFMFPIINLTELPPSAHHHVDKMQEYVVIFIEVLVWMIYYVTMDIITLDRLFTVWLNLKYPVYWSLRKGKCLVISLWVTFAILAVIVLIANIKKLFDYYPYIWYIYIVLDMFFVISAVFAYGFIFKKFKESRIPPVQNSNINQPSLFQIFRKSRFYISVLIIGSFLCFRVTGDILFFFKHIIYPSESPTLDIIVFILWAVSDMCDAWIYIFAQKSVQKIFRRKFQIIFCCFRRERSQHIQGHNSNFTLSTNI